MNFFKEIYADLCSVCILNKFDIAASNFLELASEQRLKILHSLNSNPFRVSQLAKKLDTTPQEIHRHLERLTKCGFVKKHVDEYFHITAIGRIMLSQMPLIFFISQNSKYFSNHDLAILPLKFIRRLGVLENCTLVKGVTNVLDTWKNIYKNSKEYVCDITSEFPLGMDAILTKKIEHGMKYRHIISNNLNEHDGRVENLKKNGYYSLLQKGRIERKEIHTNGIILILNEKESGIIFPTSDGEVDLRRMFYAKDKLFQDWCLDYFEFNWKKAKKINRLNPRR